MKRSKFSNAVFSLIVFIGFSSCASLFHAPQSSIVINSEPTGAVVMSPNGERMGETPLELTSAEVKEGFYLLQKDNYIQQQVEISRRYRGGWIFFNAMFFGIPSIRDARKGILDYWEVPVEAVKLRREKPKSDNPVKVYIGVPVLKYPDETISMKLSGEPLLYSNSREARLIGNMDDMSDEIYYSSRESIIDPMLMPRSDKKVAFGAPKIALIPEIIHAEGNYKGNLLNSTGSGSLELRWNIYATVNLKTPIRSIVIKTTSSRPSSVSDSFLKSMFADNTTEFLNSDSILDILRNAERTGKEAVVGEEIRITKVTAAPVAEGKNFLKQATESVVTVETPDGHGSGFIISSNGYIVTNYHVVEELTEVKIKMKNGIEVMGKIIKRNAEEDLALVKVDLNGLSALVFGNEELAEAGDDVWAIGTPLDKSLGSTITKGIISGFREDAGHRFIQTDVSINEGNSGGPLLNDKGEVLGVTTFKFKGKGIEGIGFALPVNTIIKGLNIKFE